MFRVLKIGEFGTQIERKRHVSVPNLLGAELLEQLEGDPGLNEREEIERLLAKVETALAWLDPNDLAGKASSASASMAFLERNRPGALFLR